jgi:uncharacterized protein with von Willebrand factor type A (vWA) domain
LPTETVPAVAAIVAVNEALSGASERATPLVNRARKAVDKLVAAGLLTEVPSLFGGFGLQLGPGSFRYFSPDEIRRPREWAIRELSNLFAEGGAAKDERLEMIGRVFGYDEKEWSPGAHIKVMYSRAMQNVVSVQLDELDDHMRQTHFDLWTGVARACGVSAP